MERLTTGEPVWSLTFDQKGRLTAPSAEAFRNGVAAEDVVDLFVFSHGWGTSERMANDLYGAMFPLIRQAAGAAPGIGKVGFAGIHWPSLWFPDTPASVPRPAGATQAADGAQEPDSAGTAVLSGAQIADSLRPGFEGPAQQETILALGKLIDEGEAADPTEPDSVQEKRLLEFHTLLGSLVPALSDGAFEDAGESALLFTDNPRRDYQAAAEVFGSVPAGSSQQGIGDWFTKALAGAKDTLRVFSYTVMKARAGDIGRAGLGPLLSTLPGRSPGVRVHLIGHSFGARLVSFALAGVGTPAASPVASLLLLQGAFSHWSFAHAQDNPFGGAGALNQFADRVHGPLVATYSSFDWAVGRWYPKASFLSRQDTEGVDAGRWEGLGADGFRAVNPSVDRSMPAGGGVDYGLVPGTFFRVDAAGVINDVRGQAFAGAHSDIRKLPVAELAVAAALAHS
jgi:hypothetical protein